MSVLYMHRNGQEIDVAFMFGNKDELAEFLNVSENWAELECQGDAAFKYSNWELSCVEWTRVAELIHAL